MFLLETVNLKISDGALLSPILISSECRDKCVTTLVLEVETLKNKTNQINLNQTFPLPWNRLNLLQNTKDQLQVSQKRFDECDHVS